MSKIKNYPKISIITPSFNQGQFIKETIESVLNQNYPHLEYLVMDGGSTDETVKILKSYGEKINWVSKKDRGQAAAINEGIKKSTGEIIAYLNSDDVMLPHTLKRVADYFMSHDEAMWLTGDYSIINEKGQKIQSFVPKYKTLLRKLPYFNTLVVANFIIQPSTFWKRSLTDEIGFLDESLHLCLDFDYWLRIIKKHPLHVLPNKLSLFRIHGASKGLALYEKQFKEEHRVMACYTDNIVLKTLHKIHSGLIILVYNLIK